MYSTDNGPHMNTWPDGAMTPFRSEKNTNWEGAFRVPLVVRWPGKIPAGVVSNEIVQHHDWLPTFLAAAGEPDIVEKLKEGTRGGGQDLQGAHRRLQPAAVPDRQGGEEPAPGLHLLRRRRRLVALRFDNWKVVFMEQRAQGTLRDLGRAVRGAARAQALQPAHRSVRARRHHVEHLLRLVHRPTSTSCSRRTALVAPFLATFKEFPPRQKAASFTIDQAMAKLESALTAGH